MIDGIPGSLDNINVNDVESISVLKDASASAVYGARAAFGVILVTTRSAEEGTVNVDYQGSFGVSTHAVCTDFVTDAWTNSRINDQAFFNTKGTHLFSYSEENLHYLCGKQRKIVEFRGVRILLQICYDLRFPVWSRNCGDYDLALYVASWPVNRIAVWDLLLKARAVENQCYVVGANRVGADPVCDYTGNSAIIHPYGKAMAELRGGESGCVSAELDMEWLSGFRDKFPSLRDADKFHIEV